MSAAAVATATASSSTTTLSDTTTRSKAAAEDGINSTDNDMVDRDETAHQPLQLHQRQHLQPQETKVTTTSSIDAESTSSNRGDNPLPSDLRRILMEVSRTGSCSWLSWTQEGGDHDGVHSSAGSRAGSSSPLVGTSPGAPASLNLIGVAASASRQPFAGHRRPPYAAAGPQVPPRKKHRNGLHKGNRRRFVPDGAAVGGGVPNAAAGRKRPLLLIRTTAATGPGSATAGSTYSASSVGSGRTSGSEPDDSTQYECDSDTTNSEISFERRDHHLTRQHQRLNSNAAQASKMGTTAASGEEEVSHTSRFKTLREAFRVALGLVLDHFYKSRGGYKLSPAEKRRNETLQTNGNSNNGGNSATSEKMKSGETRKSPLTSEAIFRQRRLRLTAMLSMTEPGGKAPRKRAFGDGPPFTIQRVAEVLVAPERYYTQTHKLCNCLEKLLLVTSSTNAFGGSTGGDTSQSRREERELAALADEKGREEMELRRRRLRRRQSSPTDEVMGEASHDGSARAHGVNGTDEAAEDRKATSPEKKALSFDEGGSSSTSKSNGSDGDPRDHSDPSSQEMLEAAARASLRTKFDHVGIDPHSSAAAAERDVRTIAENRGMTNSPPPPSLAIAAASNMALPGHGVAGFVRQHLPEQSGDHQSLARVPSPILFSPSNDSPIHTATNMHMLQLHHAAALAGVSMTGTTQSPLDMVTLDDNTGAAVRSNAAESAFLEVEHASNSDADSESDDVSLDDSASDRSDGSDSGSATHHEPFTAARAMALNRMQQQQRLQSRGLTSLTASLGGRGGVGGGLGGGGGGPGEGFRPPADSEYQSGDSMDSMRAEDSGGSDSSSSDLAD